MSSSTSKTKWIYEVFINFRGEDTRSNFVSHLYATLSNAGINTFLDDENLEKGKELGPELLRAIQGSQIIIVVFSKNYVQSSWCLDELEQIMECHKSTGQVVMPVFYGVTPSFIREYASQTFGEAIVSKTNHFVLHNSDPRKNPRNKAQGDDHYRLKISEKKDSLEQALGDASILAGWDMDNYSNESSVVKEIVGNVLKKLDKKYLPIPDFPVGLESRAEKLIQFLRKNTRGVCLVGIWGMGGIGKSTIAKVVYNNLCYEFEDQSFLANIRQVWEKERGQIDLQEQLLSDILKTRNVKVHNVEWGKAMINERLCTKRALVILDDVSTREQLNALCGNRNGIGPGSIIIITTRDARLLDILGVDFIYEAEGLNVHESRRLFNWHAFKEANPSEAFLILSGDVVSYCGGLPLALEVLGSYLFNRRKREWQSVISKLQKIPNDQIHEKLKISFDGLEDHMEKNIFLDVCCFFIGKDRAYVTEILNGCGLHADIGIEVLIERSLLKVEKNNKLGMHALLRDMGREIVRESSPEEPEKRTRLWCFEDVVDVLAEQTGTKAIEGLVLKSQRTSRVCFNTIALKKMKKLRLLQLDNVQVIGDYECFSKQLRWLSWQGFPLKYMPENFYQKNVVAMDLKHSNLTQVWKKPQLIEGLKILNLSHSKYLKRTPDFSKLPNLEKLIMKDCQSLLEVHPSIGDLNNLLLINLKDCTSLSNLPREIYQLRTVKTLILSGCSKIDKLDEDILQMESLKTLMAANTRVKQVPFSIVRSKSIGYISLCGYKGLSHDVFPSLIRSWISPAMNSLPCIPPFGGMSKSLASLDIESNNLDLVSQSQILNSCSRLRSVSVQCDSEIQLKQEFRRFLDNLYDAGLTEVGTSQALQISDLFMRSLLFGIGSCHIVINTLGKSLSRGLTTNLGDSLPGDNYPSWLAYKGEGPSVLFQVPKDSDSCMKGIALCVLYSSTPENLATESLTSVLIINHTKFTIQIYKRDTIMSFNDEDWQGIVSNLGVGNNVEIFVAVGHGFTVKETAVYLIYDQSISTEVEPSSTIEVDPSTSTNIEPLHEVEVQSSLSVKMEASAEEQLQPSLDVKTEASAEEDVQPSPNVKIEPSAKEEAQPSPDVKMEPSLVKNEPLPNANRKIFTRLAKRVGECLCLNQK
ncbi:disease resistance protein RUN1 isoform X2 [Medicago truncatula]|uniref:disease resistance protein RUN1 isoform X2 n=1 Tax=Medicago truncatula TaxID=3880 RepID=UPI000D2F324A|nr:disease resistance protein RUN1 isoform X2 [Medicago truncatula]